MSLASVVLSTILTVGPNYSSKHPQKNLVCIPPKITVQRVCSERFTLLDRDISLEDIKDSLFFDLGKNVYETLLLYVVGVDKEGNPINELYSVPSHSQNSLHAVSVSYSSKSLMNFLKSQGKRGVTDAVLIHDHVYGNNKEGCLSFTFASPSKGDIASYLTDVASSRFLGIGVNLHDLVITGVGYWLTSGGNKAISNKREILRSWGYFTHHSSGTINEKGGVVLTTHREQKFFDGNFQRLEELGLKVRLERRIHPSFTIIPYSGD